MNTTTPDFGGNAQSQDQQMTLISMLIIQILTLITTFIAQIVAQVHKNKIDQIHEQNKYQTLKIEEIQKQQSAGNSQV